MDSGVLGGRRAWRDKGTAERVNAAVTTRGLDGLPLREVLLRRPRAGFPENLRTPGGRTQWPGNMYLGELNRVRRKKVTRYGSLVTHMLQLCQDWRLGLCTG